MDVTCLLMHQFHSLLVPCNPCIHHTRIWTGSDVKYLYYVNGCGEYNMQHACENSYF